MNSRCIFPLRFRSNPGSNGEGEVERSSKINQDRDAWALHKFLEALRCPGDLTEDLFNVESDDLAETAIRPRMHSGDLILAATRWAAHDLHDDAAKRVAPGDNWLEKQVIGGLSQFFRWCSRKHILLTSEGAAFLSRDYKDRAAIRFQVRDDEARYKNHCWPATFHPVVTREALEKLPWKDCRNNPKRTAGYIVYLKELWPSGPSCICLWGMSGPTTYGFASAVQEIWSHQFRGNIVESLQLKESELIFAEITADNDHIVPAETPGRPDYWRNWTLAWNRQGNRVDWLCRCPVKSEWRFSPSSQVDVASITDQDVENRNRGKDFRTSKIVAIPS